MLPFLFRSSVCYRLGQGRARNRLALLDPLLDLPSRLVVDLLPNVDYHLPEWSVAGIFDARTKLYTILILETLTGTILHLQARKQRNKLAIFKKLYRILMVAVVAVTVFFVISTLALSNRADEGM